MSSHVGRWRSASRASAACAALLVSSCVAAACGGGPSSTGSRSAVAAFGNGADETLGIEVKEAEGRPRLTLVARDGDPSPGLAVAVLTQAGARTTLDLALVVEDRMETAGWPVRRRVDRDAFFVTTYLGKTDQAPLLAAVRAALATPITAADLARAEAHAAILGPLPAELPEQADLNACIGRFAVQSDKAPSLAEVEAARAHAFARGRVSLAVVGPESARKETERAWLATSTWPEGSADPEPAPKSTATAARSVAVARGAARVSIALPVADPRAAAASAAALGKASSPLRAKLSRLRVPFTIDEVGGVSKPHGGCIFVTATSHTSDQAADLPNAAAVAIGVVESELADAGAEPFDPLVASRQVARSTDTVESATIAAWWALSGPRSAPSAPLATTLLDAEASEALVGQTREATAHPRSSPKPTITLRSRVEAGQGELWVALADTCALADEAPHVWGTASLVAIAASLENPEIDGVTLEPMVDPHGVGLFAHASPRRGESPVELADRVAGAAALAMVGKPLTGDDIVEAQSLARTTLERRWGHETIGLSPFAEALAPEHPVLVEPLGSFAQVSRGDAERYLRRWRGFGAGGVGLAVLGNANEEQGAEAARAVQRWLLGSDAAATCVHSAPVARPSRVEVRGSGTTHSAWLLFGAPVADAGLASIARELLDGQSRASLSRAALSKVPGATARAWVTDGGALVVTVQVSDELAEQAEKAMTELIARISRGDVPETGTRDAARSAEENGRRELADPRTRLRLLLSAGALEPPRLDVPEIAIRFKSFASTALSDHRWIVVLAHPG